jgi:hypothetical protein
MVNTTINRATQPAQSRDVWRPSPVNQPVPAGQLLVRCQLASAASSSSAEIAYGAPSGRHVLARDESTLLVYIAVTVLG